jgi:hypothetical protein
MNYCLRETRTPSNKKINEMDRRFRRDLYTKAIFVGYPNPDGEWDPKQLFIRSDWEPPDESIPRELKALTSYFIRKIKPLFFNNNNKRRYATTNLTTIQQNLLHDLQHSDRFIIVPADKNLGPVIMERDTYINAVLSLLQDKDNYKQLTSTQAKLDMQLLQEMLNKWLEKYSSSIDKRDLDYLNRSIDTNHVEDPFSHFYIIAKVHKNPWKPRPIVSYCGSYLHGLGKWLDQQLQPIAKKMPSYISSSFDLVDILKKIKVNPSKDKLFTADANSMYTNIDTNHALQVFKTFFIHHPLCIDIRPTALMILEALEILMRNNLFKFGDTFWRQTDGTAMGAPPAPAYATIYYAIHELYLLRRFGRYLHFYRRYIDDALAIWRSSDNPTEDANQWNEFKLAMDQFGSLTWKVEDRNDIVDFMDLTITIEHNNKRLITKIFEKKENPYLYLSPSSAHTPGIIKGTITGMIFRYYALTTYPTDFYHQVELFFHRLVARGYRPGYLRILFEEALKRAPLINAKRLLKEPKPPIEDTCFLHIPFHPKNPSRQQLQQTFLQIMIHHKERGTNPLPKISNNLGWPIKIKRMIVCQHRARNLKDILFPRKFEKRPGPPISHLIPVE